MVAILMFHEKPGGCFGAGMSGGRVEGGALRTSSWDGVNGRSYWGFGLGRKFTAVCVPYSPTLWLSIASVPPTAKPGCVDWLLGACGLKRGRVQIPPGANPFHSLDRGE